MYQDSFVYYIIGLYCQLFDFDLSSTAFLLLEKFPLIGPSFISSSNMNHEPRAMTSVTSYDNLIRVFLCVQVFRFYYLLHKFENPVDCGLKVLKYLQTAYAFVVISCLKDVFVALNAQVETGMFKILSNTKNYSMIYSIGKIVGLTPFIFTLKKKLSGAPV